MELVAKENFNNMSLDIFGQNQEYFLTRRQIGEVLEYSKPEVAIGKIHARHKKQLDSFSVFTKLVNAEDDKVYDMYYYSFRGVIEICRYSRQINAEALINKVYDFMYNGMKQLQRTITAQQEHISILESKIELPKLEAPKKTPEEILLTPPKWVNDEDDKERYRQLILFILKYIEEDKPPMKMFRTYLREKSINDTLGATNNIDIYKSARQKAKKYYETCGTAEKVLEYIVKESR